MTPTLLMILGSCTLAAASVALAANFVWMAHRQELTTAGMAAHLFTGLAASAGGLSLAAGFVWWLAENYGQ